MASHSFYEMLLAIVDRMNTDRGRDARLRLHYEGDEVSICMSDPGRRIDMDPAFGTRKFDFEGLYAIRGVSWARVCKSYTADCGMYLAVCIDGIEMIERVASVIKWWRESRELSRLPLSIIEPYIRGIPLMAMGSSAATVAREWWLQNEKDVRTLIRNWSPALSITQYGRASSMFPGSRWC